jgi:arylsulfatase A-like enzyme
MKTKILLNTFAFCTTALAFLSTGPLANAQAKKPNILIIWGDDIGQFNISAYNMGMMGYQTPNIDRLAKEGAIFTDWYGQQSCTAGRSAFITGQSPIRTGLTKVGLSGAPEGLKKEDPTLAELLKPYGYACGQFGKTIWATATSFYPRSTGLMSFWATSTI